jgi:hypothetical protein
MRLLTTLLMLSLLGSPVCAATKKKAAVAPGAGDNTPPKPAVMREVKIKPVPRPTPNFSFPGPGGRTQTLSSLRGQPVVLLVADSPKNGAFRKQLDYIAPLYSEFATRKAVFIAAFTREGGEAPVKSNVPFVVANNGPSVAAAYNVTGKYNTILIGPDGNVNYQTGKVLPGFRIRDVMQNSYPVQTQMRR